jgi:hypothetical protein
MTCSHSGMNTGKRPYSTTKASQIKQLMEAKAGSWKDGFLKITLVAHIPATFRHTHTKLVLVDISVFLAISSNPVPPSVLL